MLKVIAITIAVFILANNVACKHEENSRIDEATLENNTWKLSRYGYETEEPRNVPENSLVTLIFDTQSKVVKGAVLCNSFKSSYALTGNKVSIATVAPTELYCGEDEEGIAVFVVSALMSIVRYEIEGERLLIYSVESGKLEYKIK